MNGNRGPRVLEQNTHDSLASKSEVILNLLRKNSHFLDHPTFNIQLMLSLLTRKKFNVGYFTRKDTQNIQSEYLKRIMFECTWYFELVVRKNTTVLKISKQ